MSFLTSRSKSEIYFLFHIFLDKKHLLILLGDLRYGVDDYLAKPFDLEEFLLRLERLIKKKTWYEDNRKKRKPKKPIYFISRRSVICV